MLNRADAKVGLTAGDVEKSARNEIAAKIPSSRDVPTAVNRGQAIVTDNPKHPVSQAIRALADSVVPNPQATADDSAQPGRSSHRKRGRFRSKGD